MSKEVDIAGTALKKFDFIANLDFRTTLIEDYRDLHRCFDADAWKAVHVLSGSVIEAILVEYLLTIKYVPKSGKEVLRLQLNDLIPLCKELGVLSDRATDLSTVIRGYRNLIHPGRVLRLNEVVDEKSATVAMALVDMVVDEVARARKEKYGFTAEQVVTKVENDPSCLPILKHLLAETSEYERERLALELIPAAYATSDNKDALEKCFRSAFDTLDSPGKARVTSNFLRILKEGEGESVLIYETAFFRAPDLIFLEPQGIELVVEHICGQLESRSSKKLLSVTKGLGKLLTLDNLALFFITLINGVVESDDGFWRVAGENLFASEYRNLPDDQCRAKVDSILVDAESYYEEDFLADKRALIVHIRQRVSRKSLSELATINTQPF